MLDLRHAHLDAVVASDGSDAHLDDIGGMLAFGGVEVLAIHRNGAACLRRYGVIDVFDLGASRAIGRLPVDPIVDHSAAALFPAPFAVNTECNAKFVLTQAHDERILS